MTGELPRYHLTRRTYIARAPGQPAELLEAGSEIVFEGKPGISMLPTNIEAIRALGGQAGGGTSTADRVAEMMAERQTIFTRIEQAQDERARLLADDAKSPGLRRLRAEIDALHTANHELSEAIELLRGRAVAQIDDAADGAARKRHERAVAIARARAALAQGPLWQAIESLAGILLSMRAHGAAIQDLASGSAPDMERALGLAGVLAAHEAAIDDWVLAALVQLGALPSSYRPAWVRHHGAEALALQLNHYAPEHPA